MAQVLVNDTTLTALADIIRENYFDVIKVHHSSNLTDEGGLLAPLEGSSSNSGTAFTIEQSDLPCKLFWYGLVDGCTDQTTFMTYYLDGVNVKDLDNVISYPALDLYFSFNASTNRKIIKKCVYEITKPGKVTWKTIYKSSNFYGGAYIALIKDTKTYTVTECLKKIPQFSRRTLVNNICAYPEVVSREFLDLDVDVRTKLERVGQGGFAKSSFCSTNGEGYDLSETKIWGQGFYYCSFDRPELVKLPIASAFYSEHCFCGCNFSEIIVPEGVTSLPNYCFSDHNATKIVLPSTIQQLQAYCLYSGVNTSLKTDLIIKEIPVSNINYIVDNAISMPNLTLYVKEEYIEGYENSSPWGSAAKKILPYDTRDLESITIKGPSTYGINEAEEITFEIQYNVYSNIPEEQKGVTWSCSKYSIDENGVLTTDGNATVGDTVTITAVSKYDSSIQATFTITASEEKPQLTIDLNSEWATAGSEVSNNAVYQSNSNYHVSNGVSRARITVKRYSSFTLCLRSYGETNYDYAWATKPNQEICTKTPSSSVPSYAVLNTKGASSSTAYKSYTYTDLADGDYIDIYYTKDGSGNSYEDRGYFYIDNSANYNIVVNE